MIVEQETREKEVDQDQRTVIVVKLRRIGLRIRKRGIRNMIDLKLTDEIDSLIKILTFN